MDVCMYIRMHACNVCNVWQYVMYVMYVCVRVCMYVCLYVSKYLRMYVRICAETNTNTKDFEQDVEDPCVDMSQVWDSSQETKVLVGAPWRPQQSMRLKMRRPPWRYSQPKLVQTGAQACQQRNEVVYEKSDGACTSPPKRTILSHRKASAEPDGNFRQKRPRDCGH